MSFEELLNGDIMTVHSYDFIYFAQLPFFAPKSPQATLELDWNSLDEEMHNLA